MDDLMPSVESAEKAIDTKQQLTKMGDKAGFHIRKWVLNRPKVLADVPEVDHASEIDLEENQFPVTKTLGVSSPVKNDHFLFHYLAPPGDFQYTKRNVLKRTATLFDPLGFLAPFIVKAKLFVQQALLEALEWDDALQSKQQDEWKSWFNEFPLLQNIQIPRCLKDEGG